MNQLAAGVCSPRIALLPMLFCLALVFTVSASAAPAKSGSVSAQRTSVSSTEVDQTLVQTLKTLLFSGASVADPQLLQEALAPLLERSELLSTADLKWLRYGQIRYQLLQADVAGLAQADEWLRQLMAEQQDRAFVRLIWLSRLEWLALAMELELQPELLAFVLNDLVDSMADSPIDPRDPLHDAVDVARLAVASRLLAADQPAEALDLLQPVTPDSAIYGAVIRLGGWAEALLIPQRSISDIQVDLRSWLASTGLVNRVQPLEQQAALPLRALESRRLQVRLLLAAGASSAAGEWARRWYEDFHRHQQAIARWQDPKVLAGLYESWQSQITLPDSHQVDDGVRQFLDCGSTDLGQCHPLAIRYLWDAFESDQVRSGWVSLKEVQKLAARIRLMELTAAGIPQPNEQHADSAEDWRGRVAWLEDEVRFQRHVAVRQMHWSIVADLDDHRQRLGYYASGFRHQLLQLASQE